MQAVARAIDDESAAHAAKLLLVAPRAEGGLATHVISLLVGMQREGHHLGVVGERDGSVARAARDLSLPVYEVAIASGDGPSRAAVGALQVSRALRALQAQIVHTHSFAAGLVGALALPLARRARLVATIHNYPPQADGMRSRRGGHRWALRRVCGAASRIITVSDALRGDLLAVCPEVADKCVTIPNGIDTSARPRPDGAAIRTDLGVPPEAPLVGMVARLAPQKGVLEFIRAVRRVADSRSEVSFVLAGDGPLMEDALALRRELSLDGRLHVVGRFEDACGLVAELDVLVIASRWEGSSVIAMEAMWLERPVVATRVGGVPEVVADGETGLLVEPGDLGAMARAIESLLERSAAGAGDGRAGAAARGGALRRPPDGRANSGCLCRSPP